jgi:predicted  nucleic acid-binding Zn-ribbon protein
MMRDGEYSMGSDHDYDIPSMSYDRLYDRAEHELDRQAAEFSKEIANLNITIKSLRDLVAQQAQRADEAVARAEKFDADALPRRQKVKDLEARLDAEKARADAAELKVSQLQSELSEFQFENGGILSSLAEQTRLANAALARESRLREALEDAEATLDAIESGRGGCNQHWCAETAMGQRARRAALSAPPGEGVK